MSEDTLGITMWIVSICVLIGAIFHDAFAGLAIGAIISLLFILVTCLILIRKSKK